MLAATIEFYIAHGLTTEIVIRQLIEMSKWSYQGISINRNERANLHLIQFWLILKGRFCK
jgi:hypothetical protein